VRRSAEPARQRSEAADVAWFQIHRDLVEVLSTNAAEILGRRQRSVDFERLMSLNPAHRTDWQLILPVFDSAPAEANEQSRPSFSGAHKAILYQRRLVISLFSAWTHQFIAWEREMPHVFERFT
jgi:hypothetical protein